MTRTAYHLDRRAVLHAAAGLALAGPLLVPLGRRSQAQTLDKVSFQTDWRAQAEHGGYYQAIAAGLYRKAGIECDLRQGGRPSCHKGKARRHGRCVAKKHKQQKRQKQKRANHERGARR